MKFFNLFLIIYFFTFVPISFATTVMIDGELITTDSYDDLNTTDYQLNNLFDTTMNTTETSANWFDTGSFYETDLKASTFQELVVNFIVRAGNMTIRLLVALSLLVFLWGLAMYMFKGQGSDTARVEGRKLMLWGIIGLFVMTSVWGLVGILSSILGHTDAGIPQFRK